MQERRTIIRLSQVSRVQYCLSASAAPKDGWLTNLSECGAGLLIPEHPQVGELLTISGYLPGADDILAVTGVVQWTQPDVLRRQWYLVGVEWLALEELQRNRLHTILSHGIPKGGKAFVLGYWRVNGLPLFLGVLGVLLIVGTISRMAIELKSREREYRLLVGILQQRESYIHHLRQHERALRRSVHKTQTHLIRTSSEIADLDHQTQRLENMMQRLGQHLIHMQQVNRQTEQERDALRQQQEQLSQQLKSVEAERHRLAAQLPAMSFSIQPSSVGEFGEATRVSTPKDITPSSTSKLHIRVYEAQPVP